MLIYRPESYDSAVLAFIKSSIWQISLFLRVEHIWVVFPLVIYGPLVEEVMDEGFCWFFDPLNRVIR